MKTKKFGGGGGVSMMMMVMVMVMVISIHNNFVESTLPPPPPQPQPWFVYDHLRHQCPLSISLSPPIQMDGESLDRVLNSGQSNANTAILFYASWCPFSRSFLSNFDALSSMFPQIKHLMVEESSALPSLFSKNGIHSVPALLMANEAGKMWYHGSKDLNSLVEFYKKSTGLDPVIYMAQVETSSSESSQNILQLWKGTSLKEMTVREPYLVFSLLFVFLKVLLSFFRETLSNLMALWVAYIPRLNLEIFGESRQLLGRVLHLIDVKRVFSKLKRSKIRNFHGARSARVWASSLASVSLGETSPIRGSHGGDS